MAYKVTCNDGEIEVAVIGKLDAVSAPGLEADLIPAINGKSHVTFDFARCDYISSAGLRVLLMAYKRVEKNGAMRVVNVHGSVADLLEASGFADIFGVGM